MGRGPALARALCRQQLRDEAAPPAGLCVQSRGGTLLWVEEAPGSSLIVGCRIRCNNAGEAAASWGQAPALLRGKDQAGLGAQVAWAALRPFPRLRGLSSEPTSQSLALPEAVE